MVSKIHEYKWYKECINILIKNGIESPHIKGGMGYCAKIHPFLAFATITHFRYEEVIYLLYNMIENAGSEPLHYILENIPMVDDALVDGSAYIYLIKNDVTNLTKIGMTGNPKRRLKEIDTGNGVRLSYVLCEFVPNCSVLENKLHNKYKHVNGCREWFNLTETDINEITNLINDWVIRHYKKDMCDRPSKFCHRICEHCGRQFGVFYSDILRGKGMFCDNACASYHRKSTKIEKVCKLCGSPFKTTVMSKEFCSTECERLYSINNPLYKLNVEITRPIGHPNAISHRVCQLCHRIISLQDDKIVSGEGVFCSKSCARLSKHKIQYKKICEYCGLSFFTTYKDMKYCSIECEILDTGDCISYAFSDETKELILDYIPFVVNPTKVTALNLPKFRTKTCEECGNSFLVNIYDISRRGSMFCSRDCQFKNINSDTKAKVCKTCGVIFKTTHDKDYCSDTCENYNPNSFII
jgi:hypothetical protein